jgi:hypothetical protein
VRLLEDVGVFGSIVRTQFRTWVRRRENAQSTDEVLGAAELIDERLAARAMRFAIRPPRVQFIPRQIDSGPRKTAAGRSCKSHAAVVSKSME